MALTTPREVKFAAGITSEYTTSEIITEIDIVEAEFYQKYYLPKRSQFSIDDDYTEFYISDQPVHEVLRVQVAVDTSVDPSGYSIVAEGSTTWSFEPGTNYITLTSAFIGSYDSKVVRVQYIPKIYNLLATQVVAANLLDITTIVDGEQTTDPQTRKVLAKIRRFRDMLRPKGMTKSSVNQDFDPFEFISIDQSTLRNITRTSKI